MIRQTTKRRKKYTLLDPPQGLGGKINFLALRNKVFLRKGVKFSKECSENMLGK